MVKMHVGWKISFKKSFFEFLKSDALTMPLWFLIPGLMGIMIGLVAYRTIFRRRIR
jgi:hypothetical protein